MAKMTNEEIKNKAKDTLGYAEATDKVSFMDGVGVGNYIAEKSYKEEIENLKRQLKAYKESYEETKKEIETVSSIINKYLPDNN